MENKIPIYMERSRDNERKRKESLYMEVSRDSGGYKSSNLRFSNPCSTFILKKSTRFFQLPACCLVHPWLTTLLLPWTNWLAPTMWTLASVKTDLDKFLGPKMSPATWILN